MREKGIMKLLVKLSRWILKAKVIMVTALSQEDLLAKAIKMGVKDFCKTISA